MIIGGARANRGGCASLACPVILVGLILLVATQLVILKVTGQGVRWSWSGHNTLHQSRTYLTLLEPPTPRPRKCNDILRLILAELLKKDHLSSMTTFLVETLPFLFQCK